MGEDRPLPCVNLQTNLPGGEDTQFTDQQVRLQSAQLGGSKAAARPSELSGAGERGLKGMWKGSASHFRSGPLRPHFLESRSHDIPAPLGPHYRMYLAPSGRAILGTGWEPLGEPANLQAVTKHPWLSESALTEAA